MRHVKVFEIYALADLVGAGKECQIRMMTETCYVRIIPCWSLQNLRSLNTLVY